MSAIPHHTSDPTCALCELKLTQAHPELGRWFRDVKSRHANIHISWSYRDQASQEQAFSDGASGLHYPKSAHNHTGVQGEPLSLALDVFQIDDLGRAKFDPIFCARINDENEKAGIQMLWGGTFKDLGDSGHFQLTDSPDHETRT